MCLTSVHKAYKQTWLHVIVIFLSNHDLLLKAAALFNLVRIWFMSGLGGAEAFWDKSREAPPLPGTAGVFTPETAAHRGPGW